MVEIEIEISLVLWEKELNERNLLSQHGELHNQMSQFKQINNQRAKRPNK